MGIQKMSLYAMWLKVHKANALPEEWRLAHHFLTWATANGYKPEYDYEGDFTPDSLMRAIQTAKGDVEQTGEQLPDAVRDLVSNNTLAELKEMAKGIDLGKATKKEDIARLIVAATVVSGIDYGKTGGDQTVIVEG